MADRINIPPPTRVAIGFATITTPQGKQRAEVFIDVEWARYFESLNTGFNTISAAVGLPGAPGATGAAGAAVSFAGSDEGSAEFIPGPPGQQGPQGDPGPAAGFIASDPDAAVEFIPGPPGAQGPAGKDGAPVGFLVEEEASIEFIPGPPGAQGSQGAQGVAGAVVALMFGESEPSDIPMRQVCGGNPLTDGDPVTGSGSLVRATSPTITTPIIAITTFANLPSAASSTGCFAFASDVGANGTLLRSNGTRWLPTAGRIVLVNQTASGNISNTETIVMQSLIPVGLMAAGDVLSATYGLAKSGVVDGCNFAFRLGTGGTIADTNLTTANTGSLAAANVNGSGYVEFQIVSATSTQRVGAQGPQGHFSAVSANATQAAVAITSAATNALYASFSIVSTGATNTTKLQSGRIELITG